MTAEVHIALIHHPVLNKPGDVVATAVTNLDIHDLARLAITFGCKGLYVVTPLELQQKLVRRLVKHWREGRGSEWNLTRRRAFELVDLAQDLEEVRTKIKDAEGEGPKVVATTARDIEGAVSYAQMRETMKNDNGSWLILLGTGWGLTRGSP